MNPQVNPFSARHSSAVSSQVRDEQQRMREYLIPESHWLTHGALSRMLSPRALTGAVYSSVRGVPATQKADEVDETTFRLWGTESETYSGCVYV